MIGVDRRDPARVAPRTDHGGLFIDETFQIALDRGHHARRPLQDLIGEEPAFARHFAAHLQFAAHVAHDLRPRLSCRVKRAQGRKPHIHQPAQQLQVDGLFRGEIIQQVRLGQARRRGNLIQRGPPKPLSGKDLERGVEDRFGIAPLDAGLRARALAFVVHLFLRDSPGRRVCMAHGLCDKPD